MKTFSFVFPFSLLHLRSLRRDPFADTAVLIGRFHSDLLPIPRSNRDPWIVNILRNERTRNKKDAWRCVNETYSNVFTFVGLNFRITVILYHVEQKEKSKLSNSQLSRGEEI